MLNISEIFIKINLGCFVAGPFVSECFFYIPDLLYPRPFIVRPFIAEPLVAGRVVGVPFKGIVQL
jgi:hypothetical protein